MHRIEDEDKRYDRAVSGAPRTTPSAAAALLFAGPGDMRARCRAHDWSATPLGAVETWSPALRLCATSALAAGFPTVLLWGPTLVQIYNDASIRFFGVKHPAGLGVPAYECWPEVRHLTEPIYARVMAGETVTSEEQLYPLRNAGPDAPLEDVYLTVSFSPVGEPGAIAGIVVTSIDVTQRISARRLEAERETLLPKLEVERTARLAVEAAEERLRNVFAQAPIAVAVMEGPDHVYTIVSPRYAASPGLGRQLIGRRFRDVFPEVETQGYVETVDRVYRTGEPFRATEREVRLVPPEGGAPRAFYYNLGYQPLRDATGKVYAVASVAYDVTENVLARRESEAARADAVAAQRRTARLQAVTQALAATRTVDDVATVVVADMVTVLGARTGAIAMRSPDVSDELVLIRSVGFPEPLPEQLTRQRLGNGSPLTQAYRTSQPVWVERRDGPEGLDRKYPVIAAVWDVLGVNSAAFVPLVAAGEAVGVISFAFPQPRKFTPDERAFLLALGQQAAIAVERARLFEAERAARKVAEEANRAKSQFLSTMSHELRTPLNAIGGYAELMALGIRGPVTPEQLADLARVRAANAHLVGLISDILNFARIEAGRLELHLADVRLEEIVDVLEPLIAPQMAEKQITFTHDGCSSDTAGVHAMRADPERVRQVLLNLLTNAVKFTGAGGRVSLACETDRAAGLVRIRVADTGRGIPSAALRRIFEPFVQLDRHLTNDSQQGVGLGLAISHKLARGMGGDLTVESTVGKGSTFTLSLPMAR